MGIICLVKLDCLAPEESLLCEGLISRGACYVVQTLYALHISGSNTTSCMCRLRKFPRQEVNASLAVLSIVTSRF